MYPTVSKQANCVAWLVFKDLLPYIPFLLQHNRRNLRYIRPPSDWLSFRSMIAYRGMHLMQLWRLQCLCRPQSHGMNYPKWLRSSSRKKGIHCTSCHQLWLRSTYRQIDHCRSLRQFCRFDKHNSPGRCKIRLR